MRVKMWSKRRNVGGERSSDWLVMMKTDRAKVKNRMIWLAKRVMYWLYPQFSFKRIKVELFTHSHTHTTDCPQYECKQTVLYFWKQWCFLVSLLLQRKYKFVDALAFHVCCCMWRMSCTVYARAKSEHPLQISYMWIHNKFICIADAQQDTYLIWGSSYVNTKIQHPCVYDWVQNNFNLNFTPERILVHLDRFIYLPPRHVWWKVAAFNDSCSQSNVGSSWVYRIARLSYGCPSPRHIPLAVFRTTNNNLLYDDYFLLLPSNTDNTSYCIFTFNSQQIGRLLAYSRDLRTNTRRAGTATPTAQYKKQKSRYAVCLVGTHDQLDVLYTISFIQSRK